MTDAATFTCIACNAVTDNVGMYCHNCGRPKPWEPPPPHLYLNNATGIRPNPPPANAVDWACPKCGHANARQNNFCIMCGERRPPPPR
jgi:hypothetical protein